jgi:hypothetical protein
MTFGSALAPRIVMSEMAMFRQQIGKECTWQSLARLIGAAFLCIMPKGNEDYW